MVYIVENNGVYGLTKGQFSATSDKGSKSKRGVVNHDAPIDLVGMALQLGATFVARSFSGDKEQLVPLIKAALLHKGAAFIDCISPCVAVQQPRRLDQELRLCARAQRGGEPARLHHRRARRSPPTTRPARSRWSTQHDGSVLALAQARRRLRPARPRLGADLSAGARRRRARSSPACSMSIPSRTICTTI